MSLRDQLKRAVASCASIETQHATSGGGNATDSATPAQQHPANPHDIGKVGATGTATNAQQEARNSATFDPPSVAQGCAPSCAAVASELTAHRLMKQLLAAAMRACDHWSDSPQAREDMRRQCLDLPAEDRAWWCNHFNEAYGAQR